MINLVVASNASQQHQEQTRLLRCKHNLNSHHSIHCTFLSNEEIQHGQASYPFTRWKEDGLTAIKHVVNKNLKRPLTFQEKVPAVHAHNMAFMQLQSYTKRVCNCLSDLDWDRFLERSGQVRELSHTTIGGTQSYMTIPKERKLQENEHNGYLTWTWQIF
ncbi:hypothetical protein XELAEV_18001742mg [Xenopus laevis]|nr:hypothetical protein XELAEV_18001742mg [Xenopus laevis]